MVLFPGCKCCGDGVCCPPTQEYIEAFRPLVCGQDGDIYSISLVKTPGDFNGTEYGDSFATGPVGGEITRRVETPGIFWELESYLPESAIPNATDWLWERRYLTDISPQHADDDRSVYFRLDFDGHGGNLYALFTIGCDLNDPDNLWLRLTVGGAGTGPVPYLDLLWVEIDGDRTEVLPDPGGRASELSIEVSLTKSQAANLQIAAGWSLLDWPHPPDFSPPQESFGHYELILQPLPEPLQNWSCGPDFTLPECGGGDCHLVACCTWETIIKCEPAACPPCGDECYFGDLNVPHLSCVPRDSDADLGICEEIRDWCTETYYNICNDLVFVTESMCGTLVPSDKSPCGNPSIPAYWFDGTSGNCGDTPPAATRTIVTPSATYTARRLTPGEVAALRAGNPLP